MTLLSDCSYIHIKMHASHMVVGTQFVSYHVN